MKRNEEAELSKNYQEAMEFVKDKENIFETMMGAMGDMISIQDLDMRIVYCNKMLKQVMGDHTGEFCYMAYEKRDAICEGCPIQQAYKDGEAHKAFRIGILPDGSQIKVDNVASILRNRQGKIVAGIEVIRDVRDREKAKDELQKKVSELEEFSKIAVERELDMKKLEEELEKFRGKK